MKTKQNKWYWFSFSYKGRNQGCCNVEAKDRETAIQKTIDLNIHPKHDHMEIFEFDDAELEPDKLFSRKELLGKGYETDAMILEAIVSKNREELNNG